MNSTGAMYLMTQAGGARYLCIGKAEKCRKKTRKNDKKRFFILEYPARDGRSPHTRSVLIYELCPIVVWLQYLYSSARMRQKFFEKSWANPAGRPSYTIVLGS